MTRNKNDGRRLQKRREMKRYGEKSRVKKRMETIETLQEEMQERKKLKKTYINMQVRIKESSRKQLRVDVKTENRQGEKSTGQIGRQDGRKK